MSNLHSHLLVKISDSKTDNCVVLGNIRISVITDKLIRVEISKDSNFCDLPTQKVWHRAFAKATFDCKDNNKFITVKTQSTQFDIDKSGNIVCVILADGRRINDCRKGNLKGTCRTLDGTIGAVPLGDGVISENGVTILDDSDSLLYNLDGELCENTYKNRDYYVFAYGYEYRQAVADFYKLSGVTPLMPKYVLGNWWSRYRAYTQQEYLDVMDNFIKRNIPLTIATVDMDWHLVNGIDNKYRTGNPYPWESTGWTGYTWNEKLFPDYKQFLKDLHARNLKVTLNLHPARGVRGYESMYKDMADAMGVDSKTEKPIDFDFSKYQYKNAAKTMVYNKFKNVNTKEELQKALNGLVGHKRLKSQLKELLYMAF